MLTQTQINKIVQAGYRDAQTQVLESGDGGTPDGGWDSWLVNGIGGTAVMSLFGLQEAEGEDWDLALGIYHAAALLAAENTKAIA